MNLQSAFEGTYDQSFWQDRRVLVTGGTGLVGGWLIRRLVAAQADVVCLIRDWTPEAELIRNGSVEKITVVRGDICDQECLERILGEHEIETVMQLAAQTIVGIANRNPVSTFEANIGGTWKLLEACRRSPLVKQIVMASSDKAYGDADVLPYTEETALAGRHPYDVSKSCGDLIAQTYANTYGSPVCITRCGNFYGGGDLNWNRIIPGTIRSVVRGEAPVIRSDGSFVRDYFYVEDGAAAYMHLAEQMAKNPAVAGEAFNLSTEIQLSVLDVVRKVLECMDSNLQPIVLGQASNEIKHQYLDASKARDTLHWRPLFTFEQGLQRTIQWYSNFFDPNLTIHSTRRTTRGQAAAGAAAKVA